MSARSASGDDIFLKRFDALYRTDGNGRLVCTNEWDQKPPPRFHLMRTAAGPIFRCQANLPDHIVSGLEELCRRETPDRAFERLPSQCDRYLALLSEHAPVEKVWSGPAYLSARDVASNRTPTIIDDENADLLRNRFEDWLSDVPHRQPFIALIEDGAAVSICASVRISKAVHCAGVETHPDYRQRGYASDAVAGWARAVRLLGATPFYSTSWNNVASQRVAQRLGFFMAGTDFYVP